MVWVLYQPEVVLDTLQLQISERIETKKGQYKCSHKDVISTESDSWCWCHSLQLPSSCSMLKQTSSYLEAECRREESKATMTHMLGTRTGLDPPPSELPRQPCTTPGAVLHITMRWAQEWDEPRSETSQEDIWISASRDSNLSSVIYRHYSSSGKNNVNSNINKTKVI